MLKTVLTSVVSTSLEEVVSITMHLGTLDVFVSSVGVSKEPFMVIVKASESVGLLGTTEADWTPANTGSYRTTEMLPVKSPARTMKFTKRLRLPLSARGCVMVKVPQMVELTANDSQESAASVTRLPFAALYDTCITGLAVEVNTTNLSVHAKT